MAQLMRFGRRLALPSTRQIKHELAAVGRQEDKRAAPVADKTTAELAPVPPTIV